MVWRSGLLPYGQASEVLARISGRLVSATSLWRETRRYGETLQHWLEHRQTLVSPERVVLPGEDLAIRRGVSLDEGMVNIRGEGWKEMKAGVVFDIELRRKRDPLTCEPVELPCARNMSYTAALGSPEKFAPALWRLAVEHQVPRAFHSSVTADGAEWIWNLAADYFPDSVQIVDWYHAVQHLQTAANLIDGEGTPPAKRRVDAMKIDLYQGHAARIAIQLEQHARRLSGDRADKLRSEATFFRNHQHRMNYLEFREQGWPLGSGSIESGCKQFQARLKRAGMRWSRPGAERMLALRSSVMSNYFDSHWQTLRASSPQN